MAAVKILLSPPDAFCKFVKYAPCPTAAVFAPYLVPPGFLKRPENSRRERFLLPRKEDRRSSGRKIPFGSARKPAILKEFPNLLDHGVGHQKLEPMEK